MTKRFEKIGVGQQASELYSTVYSLTKKESFSKDFELKNQINRSSASAIDNIAQNIERNNNKEFIHFLFISTVSAGETRSQLYHALNRQYITKDEFQATYNEAETISKHTRNFITYLNESEFKGSKYVKPQSSIA